MTKSKSGTLIVTLLFVTSAGCAGSRWCVPVNDIICRTPMQIASDSYEGNCMIAQGHWSAEAKKGNSAAQNNMGLIWERGCTDPQSYSEAYNWYMLAATNGQPEGAFNLGRLHENGLGVEKDVEKAVSWYTLAARKADEHARSRLADLGRPIPAADLSSVRQVALPTARSTPWRELGEWVVAFAGAYTLGAAQSYRQPSVPSTMNVDVRATCRTRVVGDYIRTECQ